MLQILVSMKGGPPAWRAGHLLGKAKVSTSAIGESTEVLIARLHGEGCLKNGSSGSPSPLLAGIVQTTRGVGSADVALRRPSGLQLDQ